MRSLFAYVAATNLMASAVYLTASSLEPPKPVVEVEETVYRYEPANNGAGPLWCQGSTCLVRVGKEVFASGIETIKDAKPLNNCRWLLFRRGEQGWERIAADDRGRTREPCPLTVFEDERVFLSANPTLSADPNAYSGPARPEILEFAADKPGAGFRRLVPEWKGKPNFTEHSYRSFAADGPARGLILFQNIGYTHAEWAFLDRSGQWSASGQLKWPWGAEYDKPQPIRVCYPNVALRGRAAHFCGVSDILEPYEKWRAYKKQITGRDWDYDFRRLFYTWTPDIAREPFKPWVEIASRDKTCGWVSPGDMWVGPEGTVHLVWTERAIDERLREKFFPEARQSYALNYAQVSDGQVVLRRTVLEATEGGPSEIPGRGRFHFEPKNRLRLIFYVSGRTKEGKPVAENRMIEIHEDGRFSEPAVVPLKNPMTDFFTATVRGGSAPSQYLDLLGQTTKAGNTIGYARIRLE